MTVRDAARAAVAALFKNEALLGAASSGPAPAPPPAPTMTLKTVWKKPWQTGTPAAVTAGSATFTPTAGCTLVAITMGFDSTRQVPLPTATTGVFATPNDGTASALIRTGTFITVGVATMPNAAAVSNTFSVPTINDGAGGTNGELGVWLFELNNVRASQLVRDCNTLDHVNTAASWANTSRTSTIQISDVLIGVSCEENSAATVNAGMSNPPAGWNALAVDQDATLFVPTTIYWKIATAGGAQSVTVSMTDPNKTEDINVFCALVP